MVAQNGRKRVLKRNGNGNGNGAGRRAVAIRARRVPPVARSAPKMKVKPVNALSDVWDTVKRALNRPAVVLVLIAVVIFWIDHYDKNGFVQRKCNGTDTPLCKWVLKNFELVAGIVIFAPALYDLPQNVMLIASVISIGAILLLPVMHWWVYAAAAFAMHTYFTSRNIQTRILVIFIAVIVFLMFR